jgi:hypothetical protein
MRILCSILVVVALASSQINAKMLVASVGPITENPVPVWAMPTDTCAVVGSCDACQPGGVQYCFYKDSGDATCCQGSGAPPGSDDNNNSTKPLLGNVDEEPVQLVASVGPITENPIPVWSSPSDTCSTVGSCDSCQVGDIQYCYYKDSGDATCCQGSGPVAGAGDDQQPKLGPAGVGPIEEDPIPSWASASDLCQRKRSCDVCESSSTQYCKYTDTGIPTCCTNAQNNNNNNDNNSVDPEVQQF